MGVVISKDSPTSPFFFTSGIIGFVSFAFTVGTFLRVIWVNIQTMREHTYLTNLRTELLEERNNLRIIKKHCKKHNRLIERGMREDTSYRVDSGAEITEATVKTMSDVIRHLIRQFKEVEKPFLEEGDRGIDGWQEHRTRRRSRDVSAHSAYSPPEKDGPRARKDYDRDGRLPRYANEKQEEEAEEYWPQRTQYAKYSLSKRFHWLYKKPTARSLFESLSRIQIRRIALQVGGLSNLVHEYGSSSLETAETIRRIDERMSRFVGVRRIDER